MGEVVGWLDIVLPPVLLLLAVVLSPLPARAFGYFARIGSKFRNDVVRGGSLTGAANANLSAKCSRHGFILPAQIHHARMLPVDATHQFRYPGLYLAFELHALEAGDLDCSPGFAWRGIMAHHSREPHELDRRLGNAPSDNRSGFAATKLKPSDFGRKTFPDVSSEVSQIISGSILLKLVYELRHREYIKTGPQDLDLATLMEAKQRPWNSEIGQIWAIAMPTVFGLAGFNPLTVYYVYRPSTDSKERGPFWLAILEVHNTFNERHIYICADPNVYPGQTSLPSPVSHGNNESLSRNTKSHHRGYEYFWEFPRTFHVSPFNDRSGTYQLFLNKILDDDDDIPTIDIKLLLMTPNEESNGGPSQKKLLATLTSSQAKSSALRPQRAARPLTASNIAIMIAEQPLDLFLPVARIMWQASKLHWKKLLPVYMRPEPHGGAWTPNDSKPASAYDGVGWPTSLNPVGTRQDAEKQATDEEKRPAANGSIFWNSETFIEATCRSNIERYFKEKTKEGPIKSIAVLSRNAEVVDNIFVDGRKESLDKTNLRTSDGSLRKDAPQLTFYIYSSAMFVDLCLFGPEQAHLIGSQAERTWGVSSLEAYRLVMQMGKTNTHKKLLSQIFSSAARRLRVHFVRWALRHSPPPKDEHKRRAADSRLIDSVRTANHPLDASGFSFSMRLLVALHLHVWILQVMAAFSSLLSVRYVRTPWAAVGDARDLLVHDDYASSKAIDEKSVPS